MAPPTIFSNLEVSKGWRRSRKAGPPSVGSAIPKLRGRGAACCAPACHDASPAPWERQSPDWRSAPLITHHSPPITSPIHAPSPSASQICRHQVLIGDFGFRVAKNYTCKPAHATFGGNDDDENRSHHAQIVRKRPLANPSPESDKNFASS